MSAMITPRDLLVKYRASSLPRAEQLERLAAYGAQFFPEDDLIFRLRRDGDKALDRPLEPSAELLARLLEERAERKAAKARAPAPAETLEPEREQLATFIDAMFVHATSGSYVSLRSFLDDGTHGPAISIQPIKIIEGSREALIEAAYDEAWKAAHAEKKVVFAPPVATFTKQGNAKEDNVSDGLDICAELDEHPQQGLATLERLLGPATIVIASGGTWRNPETGKIEQKLHAHWRLSEPARGDDRKRLKEARTLAIDIVSGDPTIKSTVHPLRWPGSWHRKADPVLCSIVSVDADREIDLTKALEILRGAKAGTRKTKLDRLATQDEEQDVKPPMNIRRAFADMEFQPEDKSKSVHLTQLRTTAALLQKGNDLDAVVEGVLDATRKAAGADGNDWDWDAEEATIRKMGEDWLAKHPPEEEEEQQEGSGKFGFVLGTKGVYEDLPLPIQANIKIALRHLDVMVKHNAFQDRSIITGLEGFELLNDPAVDRLWLTIDQKFKFKPTREFFFTVVADLARRNSFHPVRDYLNALKWDGENRIDTWLTDYADAKDTPLTRAVGALMLVAAVRRVRKPGCKFDEMPVLQSEQGQNKSTALQTLAVEPEWFSDDLPLSGDSKKMIEHLKGRWIIEAAELNGMRKSDVTHLKSFLSRTVDRARMSYDRLPGELERQCIIVGTTNDEKFLRDQTGNRRYWPIVARTFDLAKLKADRDQLWAEAAEREAEGVSIRLPQELWAKAAVEQKKRTIDEPWIELIENELGDANGKFLAYDIWSIVDVLPAQRTQAQNERISVAMKACGWRREKVRFPKIGVKWGYVRGPKPYKLISTVRTAYTVEYTEPPK